MQSATTAAAVGPHLPVRQEWLDRRREEIIEPDLPIVDPHHHLVDRPETGRYLLPQLLADPPAPLGEYLVALAGIAAEADRAADMVEHDLRLGKGARQIDQLAELGVVHPGVEAEAERRETRESFPHAPVHQ